MAFVATDSTKEPRAFSIGPLKVQLFTWTALASDTTGTITCDRFNNQVMHVILDGALANTSAPSYATNVATLAFSPTVQATYTYTVSSASATVGAIYASATGVLFSVNATIASQTTLVSLGDAPPGAASGTLTKIAGTGDATITYSAFTASAISGTAIAFGI